METVSGRALRRLHVVGAHLGVHESSLGGASMGKKEEREEHMQPTLCSSTILCTSCCSSTSRSIPPPSSSSSSSSSSSTSPQLPSLESFKFETILVEVLPSKVGVITLNRPKQLNALCLQLTRELRDALMTMDHDPRVHAIVLTGSDKSFAAGADIKEMEEQDLVRWRSHNLLDEIDVIMRIKKPIIAAVRGIAFGGGCEVAMLCDVVIAGENAKFSQPEVKIGTMPGAGGSQRLTRALGKSRAMELILTGNVMDAKEAERRGLVSRVVPTDKVLPESIALATQIASLSLPVVIQCKSLVNISYETHLGQGHAREREVFLDAWTLQDRREGMAAFKDKRKPQWTHS